MKSRSSLVVVLIGSIAWSGVTAQTPQASQTESSASSPSTATHSPAKTPKRATVTGPTSTNTDAARTPGGRNSKAQHYDGNTGAKGNTSTACSTARTTADGKLDCGMTGEGARPGKVPK